MTSVISNISRVMNPIHVRIRNAGMVITKEGKQYRSDDPYKVKNLANKVYFMYTLFNIDPDKSFYRVRISNLPWTVTKEQLLKRLDIGSEVFLRLNLPDKPNSSSSMVAYLINQPSEKFIRDKILAWHGKTFSEGTSNKMQCQLEMNMDFFDWDDKTDLLASNARSRASSSASSTAGNIRSTKTKLPPWCKGKKESLPMPFQTAESNINDDEPTKIKRNGNVGDSESTVHIREPVDMAQLAPQWRWTNKRLSNDQAGMGCTYSLVHKKKTQIKAAIKVYMTQHNPTARLYAQHERIALEKLTGKQTILSSLIVNLYILL